MNSLCVICDIINTAVIVVFWLVVVVFCFVILSKWYYKLFKAPRCPKCRSIKTVMAAGNTGGGQWCGREGCNTYYYLVDGKSSTERPKN